MTTQQTQGLAFFIQQNAEAIRTALQTGDHKSAAAALLGIERAASQIAQAQLSR